MKSEVLTPLHLHSKCDTDSQSVTSFLVGDGRMGYAEEAPYDAIHVGAAAPVVPQAVSWDLFFYLCVLAL